MNTGEGMSQRTHMHDLQTRTAVWCWPTGKEARRLGGGGQGGWAGTSAVV